MEVKEHSEEMKIKLTVATGSLLTTDKKWVEVSDPQSAKDIIDETVEHHQESMQEFVDEGEERWKQFIEDKVVDKEWGETRTMNLIQDFFNLSEEDEEFLRKWIEIFRKVRLEDMDQEKAERIVEHGQDPNQKKLGGIT